MGTVTKQRSVTSIWLPSTLSHEAGRLAEREGRTKSELIRESLRQYIWQARWENMRAYGVARAALKRLSPDRVDSMVHAYRRGAQKTARRR